MERTKFTDTRRVSPWSSDARVLVVFVDKLHSTCLLLVVVACSLHFEASEYVDVVGSVRRDEEADMRVRENGFAWMHRRLT